MAHLLTIFAFFRPLGADKVNAARSNRMQEIKFQRCTLDILAYLAFTVLVMFVAYGVKDQYSYLFNRALKHWFVQAPYNGEDAIDFSNVRYHSFLK